MNIISKRSFLLGLGAALTAPAVVRASNLMPVSARMLDVTITPEMFGAVGDAVTDDTAAFVRMFDHMLIRLRHTGTRC